LWRVSGWAVQPPLGHPTPSRQRIFINNRAVKAPLLATTIDKLFSELYKAILKHEAPGRGELLSIKKANNQHSMFVLSIFCPPELVEILPEAGGGTVLVEDWIPVQEAVRQAILTAWNPVLTTALLNEEEKQNAAMARSLLHAAPVSSQNALQYNGNYNNNTSARRSLSDRPPNSRTGATSHNTREMLPLIRLPPQRSFSTGSEMMKKSTADIGTSNDTTLPSLLLTPKPSLDPASNQQQQQQQSTLMASWRQRRELSRYRPASGAAGVSVMDMPPSKRPRRRSTGIHSSSVSEGSGSQVETKTPGSYSALDAILSSWKNPALMPDTAAGKSQAILSLEGLSSAVFARLRPEALERENLQGARALHQVDSKFVPIVCSNGILALIDQHAADERVQLEKLRAQIIAPTGGPVNGAGQFMELPTPQPLRLGADEVPLLEEFGNIVWQWGWRWVAYPAPAAPEMLVEVTAVPLIAQRALTATDMRIYLHDLAATHGGSGPPSGVIRVLNSKACRTAIMFGDELLPVQCQDLVDNLQNTKMCFICAHGRPTTAPVVDLVAVGKAAAVLQATVGAKKKGNSQNSRGKRLSGLKDKLVAALKE
jgi:DNA mismatch repair ATPase MutL